MKIPQGVKFPLKIEWWGPTRNDYGTPCVYPMDGPTNERGSACTASVYDASGFHLFTKKAKDDHGFGQEEIDALQFIVDAANLMAEKPKVFEWAPDPKSLPHQPYSEFLAECDTQVLKTLDEACDAIRRGYPAMPVHVQDAKDMLPKGAEHQKHGDAWARGTAEAVRRMSESPHYERPARPTTDPLKKRHTSTLACSFDEGWAGICNKPRKIGSDFCKKHSDLKCSGCGKPAVKECPETLMLVCGYPLCATCKHLFDERGRSMGHGPRTATPAK